MGKNLFLQLLLVQVKWRSCETGAQNGRDPPHAENVRISSLARFIKEVVKETKEARPPLSASVNRS